MSQVGSLLGKLQGRLIVATTKARTAYTDFAFEVGDTLLFGRESAGVTDEVAKAAHGLVHVPMAEGMRSLNVAVTAGMILGEALRQTGAFPPLKETAP